MNQKTVIEHVRGNLKSGVKESTFLHSIDVMHELVKGNNGLVRAVVHWNLFEEAEQANA